jgi:hypothetical protein
MSARPLILSDGIILPSLICACGHPSWVHNNKACTLIPNCNCKYLRPFLEVDLPTNFFNFHDDSLRGHALIQGVLDQWREGREVHLANADLGKTPTCHRCGVRTACLMPVLVNKNSRQRVTEVRRGIMTRLWCRDCVVGDGGIYDSTIELVITEGMRSRFLDSGKETIYGTA